MLPEGIADFVQAANCRWREEKPIDTSPVLDLKVFVSAEDFDIPKSFMPIFDSRSIGLMARLRSFRSGDTDLARSEN